MLRAAIRLDAAVLGVAAALLLLLAFDVWHVGSEPGAGPWEQSTAAAAFFFASVVGMALAVGATRRAVGEVALLAPLAALCVTFSYYDFDPYFAPQKRRYSDGGAAATWWIYVVLLVSLGIGAVAWRRPRLGATLTVCALPVSLLTFLIAGDGH